MIDLRNVSKRYTMGNSSVAALDEVSLHIDAGEFVAILGPSGSGKSTLMHIIGCLDLPTQGTYHLDGLDVTHVTRTELAGIRNQKIGFIFQGFQLLNRLTALENVELPLIYSGMHPLERHEKATAALRSVGLGARLSHLPSEMSGGQQQRVAVARALVTNPPVLLADEPTGNLDEKATADVLSLLCELHQKGNTLVLITHDGNVAARAKRRITIRDGQIEAMSSET